MKIFWIITGNGFIIQQYSTEINKHLLLDTRAACFYTRGMFVKQNAYQIKQL